MESSLLWRANCKDGGGGDKHKQEVSLSLRLSDMGCTHANHMQRSTAHLVSQNVDVVSDVSRGSGIVLFLFLVVLTVLRAFNFHLSLQEGLLYHLHLSTGKSEERAFTDPTMEKYK